MPAWNETLQQQHRGEEPASALEPSTVVSDLENNDVMSGIETVRLSSGISSTAEVTENTMTKIPSVIYEPCDESKITSTPMDERHYTIDKLPSLQLDEDFDIDQFTSSSRDPVSSISPLTVQSCPKEQVELPDDDDFLALFPSIDVNEKKKAPKKPATRRSSRKTIAQYAIRSPENSPERSPSPPPQSSLVPTPALSVYKVTPGKSVPVVGVISSLSTRDLDKPQSSPLNLKKRPSEKLGFDRNAENRNPKRGRIVVCHNVFDGATPSTSQFPLIEKQMNIPGNHDYLRSTFKKDEDEDEDKKSDEDDDSINHSNDSQYHEDNDYGSDDEDDSDYTDEVADMLFPNIEDSINFDVGAMIRRPKGGFNKNIAMGDKRYKEYRREKLLTTKCIKRLYNSILNIPKDPVKKDPKGLKVPLMSHQKLSLKWMKWREEQEPCGGILADDMGLGKTLQLISLVLDAKNERKEKEKASGAPVEDSDDDLDDNWGVVPHPRQVYNGRTLLICPPSLIEQWEREIHTKVRPGLLKSYVYHGGGNKTITEQRLVKYDIVITSYHLLAKEHELHVVPKRHVDSRLYKIHWERVILDEAHFIRNHKGKQNTACCEVIARSRWALTGTPIQNKETDLFALLKFLKCSPFDEPAVWRKWVAKCTSMGSQRLVVITKSLMLRRTKEELITQGMIANLPDKKVHTIEIELDSDEMMVYHKLLMFSQTYFVEFLRQRKDKEYFKLHGFHPKSHSLITQEVPEKLPKSMKFLLKHHKQIEPHLILTLILRLRQMCCHASLISVMLDKEDMELCGFEQTESVNSHVIDEINKVIAEESEEESDNEWSEVDEKIAKNVLSRSNPVFRMDRQSSKVRAVLKIIQEVLDRGEKVVVVSQWTSFLNVIAHFLNKIDGANYGRFTGQVPVKDRQFIVDKLNDPEEKLNILLLSLTCGGVGLNLVGANNLLIIDLHWNPQLETQAQDRIYRFGQENNVKIYRVICSNTIEEKVKQLQDKKLDLAKNILSGTVLTNILTIEDMKLLFS